MFNKKEKPRGFALNTKEMGNSIGKYNRQLAVASFIQVIFGCFYLYFFDSIPVLVFAFFATVLGLVNMAIYSCIAIGTDQLYEGDTTQNHDKNSGIADVLCAIRDSQKDYHFVSMSCFILTMLLGMFESRPETMIIDLYNYLT